MWQFQMWLLQMWLLVQLYDHLALFLCDHDVMSYSNVYDINLPSGLSVSVLLG